MKIRLIDDEQPCLDELAWLLKQYEDIELSGMDTDPEKALKSVALHPPDAVFLDIDMPKIDGLELALMLQNISPGIIIVFVTAYAKYAFDAFKAHPLDFILKPVTQARLDECIGHLRNQYQLLHPLQVQSPSFFIHCFGEFEFICNWEVKWETRRVKTLLLYLIQKDGAPSSKAELLNVLFNSQKDKSTVHNLHMTIYRLKNLLHTLDPRHELVQISESNALVFSPGVCDYIDFIHFARENPIISEKNANEAIKILNLYKGMYLEKEPFEWADESASEAENEYERIALGLASCYIAADQFEKAEPVLTKLLRYNNLSEEAYTLLLDVALKTNDHKAYLARFDQYARVMKKELNQKPDAYYQNQYEQIKPR